MEPQLAYPHRCRPLAINIVDISGFIHAFEELMQNDMSQIVGWQVISSTDQNEQRIRGRGVVSCMVVVED